MFKRKRSNKIATNEEGQSTIEFALSMLFMMGFVLFFVQLCFLFAYGNLVQYATFMAARAYLSASNDYDDQQRRAKDVIIRLLKKSAGQAGVDRYPFIAKGEGGTELPGLEFDAPQFNPKNGDSSWMQGVRYKFRGKLAVIPISPGKGIGGATVTLTSESFQIGRAHV